MESNSYKAKRVAKNTVILYFRMILLMGIHLYISRVVLNALGVEDFGVYNVVGGIVALFSILSGSLSAAASRFIAFELGTKNEARLKEIFSISITVQLVLSFLILLIAESFGLWFFYEKMDIPLNRLNAAFWCYQFSVVTFIINLLSVPYDACIVAHEKMSAFAYISLINGFGKLIIALCILKYSGDKLIFYGLLLMLLSIVIRFIYGVYCKKTFSECVFTISKNFTLFKEIFAFAGWNFIGAATDPLCYHGRNILLNMFYGPILNAAYGLAMQVNSAVNSFSSNIMMAVKPQIIKAYAEENWDYFYKILFWSAKCTFFSVVFFALPIIFNIDFVLKLWLKNIPNYTSIFVVLALINVLIEAISQPLVVAMLATGRIRNYQIVVGGTCLLNIPVCYIWLRCGGSPTSVFIVSIIISQICLFLRLYMLRGMIRLPVVNFLCNVYFRSIAVAIASSILPYVFIASNLFNGDVIKFLTISVLSTVSSLASFILIYCSKEERSFVIKKINHLIIRVFPIKKE